jgi:hypothetical protein
MLGRRRPLARAAVIGGGAYALGKRRQRQQTEDQYYEDQAAAPEVGLGDEAYTELQRLGKLKDQGILTQEEFDEQKARILESA